MSPITRGIRNTFRNLTRTISIVVILSLSIGLALAMLLAHQAVNQKIQSVKSTAGNTINISPAGVRGFEGGGNPLTQDQLKKVAATTHITKLTETLNDRLDSSNTNLQSGLELGKLGERFMVRGGAGISSSPDIDPSKFTPPIMAIGTTDPTNLADTQGGGTFTLKSGKVFSATSSDNVAVLGSGLATKNNLHVGSTFTAYGTTITVVGIFDAGNKFSDDVLLMPLATVQKLSNQAGDITNAVATVDSIDNLASTTQTIKNILGSNADVTNSADRIQSIITPLENVKSISVYSLAGAVVAGAVIILLVMIMIVRERRREIGVFKAIGASNGKIIVQFMSEAVTFTLLAAVIGVIIGIAAGNPITNTLVSNSANDTNNSINAGPGGPESFSSDSGPVVKGVGNGSRFGLQLNRNGFKQSISSIHTSVGWSVLAYSFGAALLIAILGSSGAAWLIAKVRPAEVMRAE